MAPGENADAEPTSTKVQIMTRGRRQEFSMDTTMPHWQRLVDGCFLANVLQGEVRKSFAWIRLAISGYFMRIIPAVRVYGQVNGEGCTARYAIGFPAANQDGAAMPFDNFPGEP